MPAPTPRLLVAGGVALALTLASPTAAFADHNDGHAASSGKGGPSASPTPAPQGGSGSGTSSTGGPSGSSTGKGSGSQGATDGKGGASAEKDGGDPPGNNGTVKIDGTPDDDASRGNDPHVGCTFEVDFYGFDAGDAALVTLTGHAPTGGGLLYSKKHTISDDAAGGGQDADAELLFSVQEDLRELLRITPHPQQGWHVKLEADVQGAPGGAKQKVFWIDCPAATALGGTTGAPATAGEGTTVTTAGTGGGAAGGAAATQVVSARSVERSVERTFGAGTAELAGSTTAAAEGAATVSARGAARPSVLPFTGVEGIAYLLALGAAAVGVGTVAHRLGRRRATGV